MAERGNGRGTPRRDAVRAAHARQEARRAGATGRSSRRAGATGRAGRRRSSARRSRRRLIAGIALVAVLLVAVVVAFALVIRHSGKEGQADEGSGAVQVVDAQATSPFNWENLTTDGHGRPAYAVDGQTLSRAGIDVSEHQGEIDWDAVAADGIEFCYVRAGWRGSSEGAVSTDARFSQNLAGARSAGLDVGVYFFSQATTPEEAVEEAELTLELLNGAELQYPVAFDLEPTGTYQGRADSLTREEQTACAVAFCERIEAAGYRAIVYGNRHDYERYDVTQLMRHGFWFADYSSRPSSSLGIMLWQYSGTGSVAGIQTEVDLDLDLSPALAAMRTEGV